MDMPVRKHPMPEIAAFVAELRHAFGDATIEEAVARGRAGEPTFFASENDRTVGTKSPAPRTAGESTTTCGTGTSAADATGHASGPRFAEV